MKTFIESMIVAFSMYSKIPMPTVSWNEKNMRYAFAFFPFIGIVISIAVYGCYFLFSFLNLSAQFFSAVVVVVPVIITGGIHVDGYCDTCDALSSNKDKEEKLRIMKDPNAGAFAVIGAIMLFLLQFGAWYQVYETPRFISIIFISYFLSRSLSGLSVTAFPCAKNTGLASIFANRADKKTVRLLLIIYILTGGVGMLVMAGWIGGVTLVIIALSYLYYYWMSQKQFGGITGDLAGFYLEICETAVLLIAAVAGGVF